MLKQTVTAILLITTACGTTTHNHYVVSRSPGDSYTPTTAHLVVVDTADQRLPEGEEVTKIWVFLDQWRLGSCEPEHLAAGEPCVEADVAAGQHALRLGIECRNPETLSTLTCRYDMEDAVRFAPGEHVTMSFARAIADEDPEDYLTRTGGSETNLDSCFGALRTLAAAPSCSADELRRAAEVARAARDQCGEGELTTSEGSGLLTDALYNSFVTDIDQCLIGRDRRRQSRGLAYRRRSWPPNTISGSSWRWSRDTLPDGFRDLDAEERLSAMPEALLAAVPRAEVVDQLIAAFAEEEGAQDTLVRAAMDSAWSLDVRTANGHRNFMIMAERLGTPEYSEFAARSVMESGTLHCGVPDLSDVVAKSFVLDDVVTRSEFEAVSGMVQRTDPEHTLFHCDWVFRRNLGNAVSQMERLRWLGRQDCSEARHPARRGSAIERHLRDRSPNDPQIKAPLRREFASCLERFER